MRTIGALALAAMATTASANGIDDAMKRVGPAYMCGPTYEYGEALASLRGELLKAGVPVSLAEYAVDGVNKFVVKEHATKRQTITAKECSEKYGRG